MAQGTPSKTQEHKRLPETEAADQALAHRPVASGIRANMMALQRRAGNQAVNQLLPQSTDSAPSSVNGIPPIVQDVLNSGNGQPLDPLTRNFMESRFGHNFSQVRLHTDSEAGKSARAIGAKAYTIGQHVVFSPGRYAPEMSEGQWLLAHELTHTIQQHGQTSSHTGQISINQPGDLHEQEAHQVAHSAINGGRVHSISTANTGVSIQRAEESSKLEDVSKRYKFEKYEKDGKVYKEASGRLGMPNEVEVHRSKYQQSLVSKGTGDDAGHLIGDRFGAPGGSENLSPQNWKANQFGTYKELENEWAAKRVNGIEIDVAVTDVSEADEDRPYKRTVRWVETAPDGTKTSHERIFANTHTPESRIKRGIPATKQGNKEADVIDFKTKKRISPASVGEGEAASPKVQQSPPVVEAPPAPTNEVTPQAAKVGSTSSKPKLSVSSGSVEPAPKVATTASKALGQESAIEGITGIGPTASTTGTEKALVGGVGMEEKAASTVFEKGESTLVKGLSKEEQAIAKGLESEEPALKGSSKFKGMGLEGPHAPSPIKGAVINIGAGIAGSLLTSWMHDEILKSVENMPKPEINQVQIWSKGGMTGRVSLDLLASNLPMVVDEFEMGRGQLAIEVLAFWYQLDKMPTGDRGTSLEELEDAVRKDQSQLLQAQRNVIQALELEPHIKESVQAAADVQKIVDNPFVISQAVTHLGWPLEELTKISSNLAWYQATYNRGVLQPLHLLDRRLQVALDGNEKILEQIKRARQQGRIQPPL